MTGGQWQTCSGGSEAGAPGKVTMVRLARKPTPWDLHQPTWYDCGPTCALFVRLGGAQPVKDPRVGRRPLTPAVAKGFAKNARRRPTVIDPAVSPGLDHENVRGLLAEYAPAGGGKLELWKSRALSFAWEAGDDPGAFLRRHAPTFEGDLRRLLDASPRGVVCQFLLTGGEPVDAQAFERVPSSHWVVVVGFREGKVDFYDPDHTRHERCESQRRLLPPHVFLAGHLKGWWLRSKMDRERVVEHFNGSPPLFGGSGAAAETIETFVVSAEPDRVRQPIRGPREGGSGKGSALFQIDPSAWPWDGQDLTAAEDAVWFSELAEAEDHAQATAGPRSVAVVEYGELGGGAFAVVPLAQELSPDNVAEGKLDEEDSPEVGRKLELTRGGEPDAVAFSRGSAAIVFPDGSTREISKRGRGSHRTLFG